MSPSIAAAWRNSGENWRAISLRIVCAKMKFRQYRSRGRVFMSMYTNLQLTSGVGHFL